MINNEQGKMIADTDAQLTVNHFNSIGIQSRVSTELEDKINGFDIEIGSEKIDLKRLSLMYCEISKLQKKQNMADFLIIILNDDIHHAFKIKKDALLRICSEFSPDFDPNDIDSIPVINPNKNNYVTYKLGKCDNDKLAYFNINMLNKDEYSIIDMFWLD